MLCTSIIGIGAAGNKAAIQAIEDGVVPKNKVMLLNTTLKDIPKEYMDIAINYADGTAYSGCGKDRGLSKELLLSAMKANDVDFDSFFSDEDDFITIVTSTEGGTGSGAAPIVAKYFDQQLNLPVNVFALTGFEDDARGKQNTVQFFQDLNEQYAVHAIANKKFKTVSRSASETAANKQFSTAVRILLGHDLIDSEQNIDSTDLYKISTTAGYMVVEYKEINERIKNVEQFNEILVDMIDHSATLEPPIKNKMPRMALILNLNEKSQEFVDSTAKVVRDRYGEVFEEFIQRQYDGKQEFIAVICAGMNMPVEEINAIYEKYKRELEEAKKNKEDFFDSVKDVSEDAFNVRQRRSKRPNISENRDFFKSFDVEESIPHEKKLVFEDSVRPMEKVYVEAQKETVENNMIKEVTAAKESATTFDKQEHLKSIHQMAFRKEEDDEPQTFVVDMSN